MVNKKQAEAPCPNCGHCPTCGRSNAPVFQPFYWPYWPYWTRPWWLDDGTYTIQTPQFTVSSSGTAAQ